MVSSNFSLETATLGTDANDLIWLHVGTEQFALADADNYDLTANTYAFFSNVPTWADGDAVCLALTVDGPEVSSVALTSTPGSDNTYAIGDACRGHGDLRRGGRHHRQPAAGA